jgi:hypothetical protein
MIQIAPPASPKRKRKPGGGRKPAQHKTTVVVVRLTEYESALLDARRAVAGVTTSRYLRTLIANDAGLPALSDGGLEDIKKMFSALSRMGANLNQIAYHMNRASVVDGPNDVVREVIHAGLLNFLVELQNEVRACKDEAVNLANIAGRK